MAKTANDIIRKAAEILGGPAEGNAEEGAWYQNPITVLDSAAADLGIESSEPEVVEAKKIVGNVLRRRLKNFYEGVALPNV